MFSDGTRVFQEEASMCEATNTKSIDMDRKYFELCKQRFQNDWLHSFLFGFKAYAMSESYDYFVEYLTQSYVSEKYDVHDLDIYAEPSKTKLVRYTLELLKNLCKQADAEYGAPESDYLVVKFFMLACLAREDQLQKTIMEQINGGNLTEVQTAKLVEFFSFAKNDLEHMTQSAFGEFNVICMVLDFINRCTQKRMGLLRHDEIEQYEKNNAHNKRRSQPSLLSSSSSSSYVGGKRKEEGSQSASTRTYRTMSLSTSTTFTPPPPPKREHSGPGAKEIEKLTLPELYDARHGSAQTAALAERTAAISYYAVVSAIACFYCNAYYDVQLPDILSNNNRPHCPSGNQDRHRRM